jgi:hypothetical protein
MQPDTSGREPTGFPAHFYWPSEPGFQEEDSMSMRFVRWMCCLAALLVFAGCGRKLGVGQAFNQPPVVSFDAPTAPLAAGENVTHRVSWTANDPDGRVVGYQVAVNPSSFQTISGWSATTEREHALAIHRAAPVGTRRSQGRRDFDVIAVRARDDRGAWSEVVTRAFFDENIAPSVQIVSPRPTALATPILPLSFSIRWRGEDPDGPSGMPVAYKWTLLDDTNPDYELAIVDPDSLRRKYAPGFTGWNTQAAESTSITLQNLVPQRGYVFAITAIDDHGDYDPVFSLNKNLLRFRAGFPFGPRITMFSDFFNRTFQPGFAPGQNEILVDLPTGGDVTIHWFAEPQVGLDVAGYRWALDIADVSDETPRHNQNDLGHWSEWSLSNTSATLRFRDDELLVDHRLSVEARDNLGVVSLVGAILHPVVPTFENQLLIVDDTRLRPDSFLGGSLRPPVGPWPNAAELDSFLYARGGFPWRGYPAGTMSRPGIFDGYDFDTIGTRTGQVDLTVPLATLSRYRQVIWIVDPVGATFSDAGNSLFTPMTALRYMTMPGRQNTLASYLAQGGKAWVLGGGAGYASTISWNRTANDVPVVTFSSALGELAPGRFMFDAPHWRSEFRTPSIPFPFIEKPPFPIAEYHPAPRYELFPETLQPRSSATDPVPPLRNAGTFYPITLALEHLTQPNEILEDQVPSEPVTRLESKLDTIYVGRGPALPPSDPNAAITRHVTPLMTYYHGNESGSVMFSGFDVWSFRRAQCVMLVDGVLQGVWRLTKTGGGTVAEDQTDTKRYSGSGKK